MKKIILAVAVAAVATMALVGSASAGPAGGVTATPSATKTFNVTYSAKFVRATSGIINETNRVNSAGAQNDWSPYDVWLQFRPPTHANPNCDPTGLVTPQFTYKNDRSVNPNIAGTTTLGYFIDGVTYNVCVYFVNPPVLTLTGNGSATSTTITTTGTVVYAGYANAAPNATVGLKVFHGSDCGIGQDFYTDSSYTTTNASGNYSKESGTPPGAGLYSAQTNVGSKLSNCINIGVDEFHLSLAITPNTVPSGTANPVTFSGNLTNPGPTPVAGDVVTVTAYGTDSTCTTPWIYGPWTAAAGASGQYATDPIPTGAPDGDYYYKASSMGVVSGCEHFTIEVPAVDEATGNVAFSVQLDGGLLTGNVEFAAEGTPTSGTGHLTMTNSWGYSLTGVVDCFNRIDANTAVFSGTITDAVLYQTPGYFIAKVVDNGSSGDKIAVFVNEQAPNGGCENPASDILADVTSGNLVVQ